MFETTTPFKVVLAELPKMNLMNTSMIIVQFMASS